MQRSREERAAHDHALQAGSGPAALDGAQRALDVMLRGEVDERHDRLRRAAQPRDVVAADGRRRAGADARLRRLLCGQVDLRLRVAPATQRAGTA